MSQTPTTPPSVGRTWSVLLTVFHVLVVLATLLVAWLALTLGMLSNFLFLFSLVLLGVTMVSRVISLFRKTLVLEWIRRPLAPESRAYLWQCLNRWLFFILAAVAMSFAIIPIQFTPQVYRGLLIILWGTSALLMTLALVPHRKVRITTNILFTFGWVFLAVQMIRIVSPVASAETVTLRPPFHGEWYIFQGGRSALVNHHYAIQAQRHALDIMVPADLPLKHGGHHPLADYPAFGQMLYAPADGTVIAVVNDRPDMAIGAADSHYIVGNHVVLEITGHRFVLLAHLKKGSVRVSPGDKVAVGDPLAECGNSGNTSEPHLHLQVQNRPNFEAPDLRTFPILFQDVTRTRGGKSENLALANVRRNDRLAARKSVP